MLSCSNICFDSNKVYTEFNDFLSLLCENIYFRFLGKFSEKFVFVLVVAQVTDNQSFYYFTRFTQP